MGVEIKEVKKHGGNAHQFWIGEVAKFLVEKGYKTEVENNGVDIVACKDGKKFAFEIETGKSDVVGNINKCLLKGFDKIYSLVLERELVEKFQAKVHSEKVGVVYVKDFLKK